MFSCCLPNCRRRHIGAGRNIGATWNQEQFEKRGVYIDVFEQSILIDNRPNKRWTLLASLSAELLVVSILVIVPLIYGDHLPDFRWKAVTVGPPVRRGEPGGARAQPSSGSNRPRFLYPRERFDVAGARQTSAAAAGPIGMDPPVGLQIASGDGAGSGPRLFDQRIDIKPPAPPKRDPPVTHADPIHVSGGVQMAKLVRQVMPVYPQLAKNIRVSGVVHLVGIIGKDGTIRNLQLISGHPLLAKAALEAVSQWIYRPTLLSGEPVEVICPIDVDFKLDK
jgi:protein TonB